MEFILYEFYIFHALLFVAVSALDDAVCFVYNVEHSLHRLVVCNALGVVAKHNATQLVGCLHGLLLDNLIVLDYVQHYVRCNY